MTKFTIPDGDKLVECEFAEKPSSDAQKDIGDHFNFRLANGGTVIIPGPLIGKHSPNFDGMRAFIRAFNATRHPNVDPHFVLSDVTEDCFMAFLGWLNLDGEVLQLKKLSKKDLQVLGDFADKYRIPKLVQDCADLLKKLG